jgi:L-2-hydroxyglutarate oxidase
MAADIHDSGGEIRTGVRVQSVRPGTCRQIVLSDDSALQAARVINCAGLQSDLVARASGVEPGARIVPFRGEYYELTPDARHLVNGLIYPVPDPDFPFLGVHLTRGVDGGIHAGPNAVLALSREGYRWRDVSFAETLAVLADRGFHSLAARHRTQGLDEMKRSLWKPLFVRELQRLVPEITSRHLVRAPAGVRAQALRNDGALVDDFLIHSEEALDGSTSALHVLNAPSPAATASLEIGAELARRLTF